MGCTESKNGSFIAIRMRIHQNFSSFMTTSWHLALSGLTIRPLVWPWQQVCLTDLRTGGECKRHEYSLRRHWFTDCSVEVALRSDCLGCLSWPGRRGYCTHSTYMRDIQECAGSRQLDRWRCLVEAGGYAQVSDCYLHMWPDLATGHKLRCANAGFLLFLLGSCT